jgi:broad specificity phosphatase PhoE
VHADTNRARQTAEHIHRGLLDGLDQFARDSTISGPEPMEELRNFQVWTPDGPRDITAAFRQYQALMEKLERMAVGERPRWLVEIDRFYRTQLGGADPIQTWLTIPLMYFESPQACVRRFWRGFNRLITESPGTRIIAATHSGPIRAFATWAHGYDPGEPVNTEEVVVRILQGGRTALVNYRNRVTEVNVPATDEIPSWDS